MRTVYIVFLTVGVVQSACSPETRPEAPSASTPAAEVSVPLLPDSATTKQVLEQFIIPGANALYAAEAEPPATPEAWVATEVGAEKLIQGAALLRTGVRPRDQEDWMRIAQAVEDSARKALAAVRGRDLEAMAVANGDFTAQCEDCHKIYRDAGGGMMSNPDR